MNYMKQVAEMLGVEQGEKFSVDGSDARYVIRENGMVFFGTEPHTYVPANNMLIRLLNGRSVIDKKPFFPDEGRKYYCVLPSGDVCEDIYHILCVSDCYNVIHGNCYRTKEEAEKHVDEWVQFFKGGKEK